MKKIILSILISTSFIFASGTSSAEGLSVSVEAGEKIIDVISSVGDKDQILYELEKVEDDIKIDYKNYNIGVSMTYFADETMDNLGSWGMDGTTSDFLFGTVGLYLLKNTWNIHISYTAVLAEGLGEPTFQEKIDNGAQAVLRNIADVKPEFFDLYLKPFKTSYGDFGIGYREYTFGYALEAYTQGNGFTAQDVLNPVLNTPLELPIYDPSIGKTYLFVYYKATTKNYYLTYNLPEMKYLPRGLGFKYSYGTTDRPVAIALGKLVAFPKTYNGLRNQDY